VVVITGYSRSVDCGESRYDRLCRADMRLDAGWVL